MEADTTTPYKTVKEVAAYYKVSTKTVSRWIGAGLKARNLSGSTRPDWRIKLEDVEAFLDERASDRGER